jgi:hypothetical protein
VLFGSQMLDGRIRWQVGGAFGISLPKAVEIETVDGALRWLLVAQHYDRALDLASDADIIVDDLLPLRLGLPPFVVAPVFPRRRKRFPPRKRNQRCRFNDLSDIVRMAESAREQHRVLDPIEVLNVVQTRPRIQRDEGSR